MNDDLAVGVNVTGQVEDSYETQVETVRQTKPQVRTVRHQVPVVAN